MRGHRSLIFGFVLASVWVAAVTYWQWAGRGRGLGGPNQHSSNSSLPEQSSLLEQPEQRGQHVSQANEEPTQDRVAAEFRRKMVERQLAARDITDPRVLNAMRRVPRHRFVPEDARTHAYTDGPLPIGHQQTISQPYIVGLMTQVAKPHQAAIALDVGTGSGYQAAVLSLLCDKVYSIEIVEPLAVAARQRLKELGYHNVTVRHGDGYRGWPDKGPFDLIIVAAAPNHVPQPLIDQLKPGGRLVIPVGKHFQNLLFFEKQRDGSVKKQNVAPVSFVPMTGEAEKKK